MQTDRGIPATRGDPTRAERGILALAGNGSGMELDFLTRSGDGSETGIMVSAPFKTRYIYIILNVVIIYFVCENGLP